jgi:two-component system response regulator CpxR
VWCSGRPVTLTSIEFEILGMLIRAAGRIVSRDEISAALYQREASPYERAVDVHVGHLRKKLELGGKPLIRTVRSAGYLFAAE